MIGPTLHADCPCNAVALLLLLICFVCTLSLATVDSVVLATVDSVVQLGIVWTAGICATRDRVHCRFGCAIRDRVDYVRVHVDYIWCQHQLQSRCR